MFPPYYLFDARIVRVALLCEMHLARAFRLSDKQFIHVATKMTIRRIFAKDLSW